MIKRKITAIYGFYPNPRLSARHNAARVLQNIPPALLLTRPVNAAYHNLCRTINILPPSLRSLLGLGLNFCVKPTTTSTLSPEFFKRFRDEYHRKIFFAPNPDSEWTKPPFWLASGWEVPLPTAEPRFDHRLRSFEFHLSRLFKKNKVGSNLLPSQSAALDWLLHHPEIIVCNTDKNLGPAVMEADTYVNHALKDHLSDPLTYKSLSSSELSMKKQNIRTDITNFLSIHSKYFSKHSKTDGCAASFILEHTKDNIAFMYLMPKIHKPPPLKTRAIISYSGSICYGLAVWIDIQLKKIIPHLPYIAKSSREVVTEITAKTWNPNSRLFTCDAKSMYTNIHLKHALPMLEEFLCKSELGKSIVQATGISPAAILHALQIVMSCNIFQFGDTSWLQTAGTAMGTPPAPNYATIYFCIWEIAIISKFPELAYYRRYIDDGFGIWTPLDGASSSSDDSRFADFMSLMNHFGTTHPFFAASTLLPLQWEFSERSDVAIFLDLNLRIDTDGNVHSCIYEKDLNLYLYIVPHSCHSKGSIKGTIWGMVHRAKSLCTNEKDYEPFLQKCYTRLLARGHLKSEILPTFTAAIASIINGKTSTNLNALTRKHNLTFHQQIHPDDPSKQIIKNVFKSTVIHPAGRSHISSLSPPEGGSVRFTDLTICYHGQSNLKSSLAPRKGRFPEGFSVRTRLDSYLESAHR